MKNKKIIIIMISLLVVVLGLTGYIVYDKINSKANVSNKNLDKSEETTPKQVSINLDDSRFYNIYDKLKKYTYTTNRENGYTSFDNEELIEIALKDVEESDFSKNDSDDYSLKKSTLINYLKKYFDSTVDFNGANINRIFTMNIDINYCNGVQFMSYNEGTETFKVIFGGTGTWEDPAPNITERMITNAYIEDDTIVVEEKAIYYKNTSSWEDEEQNFEIYSDPTMKNLLDTKTYNLETMYEQKLSVESYMEDASTIVTTFRKNKGSNTYYFEGSVIKIVHKLS